MRFSASKRGQFSIIAALFVATILVTSVVMTYSTIRYSTNQEEPQILSAVDEINLALKQVLGFTVGYYGSVLQVTGDSSYAYGLSSNYLNSGLTNIADIRPEWGTSFVVNSLVLGTNWFMNESYSKGELKVNYTLAGLGITGVSYTASCRLDVQVVPSSTGQVSVNVVKDETTPLTDLGLKSFRFYLYAGTNMTWVTVNPPTEPTSYTNGTYLIDIPTGINPNSYTIQVKDERGITVAASSFSHLTGSLTFNSTVVGGGDYVDNYGVIVGGSSEVGSHTNFPAQQLGPDGGYDTLLEAPYGVAAQPSYPSNYNPSGATTCSGNINDLQTNDGDYMVLHSYGSDFSGSPASFGYSSTGSSTQSIENTIRGSLFTIPSSGQAQSISVYLDLSSGASNRKVKAAIYSDTHNFIAGTEERTVSSDGWYTFNFADPKPILTVNTNYILVAWADSASGGVSLQYSSGSSNQGHRVTQTYGSWPSSPSFSHDSNRYRIYCTYLPANQYTVVAEFTGTSSVSAIWNDLVWAIDSSASSSVTATFQLYNWGAGQYPTSGDGFKTATLGTSDSLTTQTITSNPTNFLNSSGYWKIYVTAVKTTPFDLNLDLMKYSPDVPVYGLNLTEQWVNLNTTYVNPRPVLCINAGGSVPAGLAVEAWSGSVWRTISNGLVSGWNNFSISSYLTLPDFTIRFRADSGTVQTSWLIDAALIRPDSDQQLFTSLQDPLATVTVELLQNGTMRWLGQSLEISTEAIPIPPVPVKALHVNETINGVNQEVPFQVEDWASDYTVPLGMTNNNTVFGNRQMIVFLVNTQVSEFTIWWNGSDGAVQTPLAFTNQYFSFNEATRTISNTHLTLQFASTGFTVTSTTAGGASTSSTRFMRINNEYDTTDPEYAYVITSGVVRDIVLGESEYSGGAGSCINVYTSLVFTLPANASYYTYQTRLIFINSGPRTVTDLCPVSLTSSGQLQTENGTILGEPVVAAGSQTFNSTAPWGHHWSQFTDGTKGAGVMFTNSSNQLLYAFDSMPPPTLRGALKADATAPAIQLLPVTLNSVAFTTPLTIGWTGAVVTFDANTTPIYSQGEFGLWVLAELPPTIAVRTEN